ncbi:MAG: hypothetical protein HFF36_05370 [Coprobacillus sp.]|nr:hypothetical protein [Coprobacillus sp.]
MKLLNNRGSILQIVLVIFLTALFIISTCSLIMISKIYSYKNIDILMKQKNLEIMLTRFYIDSMKNDILLSDSIDTDNYSISYTVDDMGNISIITTDVHIDDYQYQYILQIENTSLKVKKIEYLEG